MKQFKIVPQILQFDTCKEFCTLFNIGKGDLILTNETYYNAYFASRIHEAAVIFLKNYGKGEPTDEMVEKIYLDIKDLPYDRLIAIGGGTIIDIAKILVQETVSPVLDLYDKRIPTKKSRELVIVPTTCGTGSEVTNVARTCRSLFLPPAQSTRSSTPRNRSSPPKRARFPPCIPYRRST